LATDGRPLSLSRDVPLFTAAAPASFLARQALDDLARGQTVVVVSPQRRVLNQIQREARAAAYWLDPENTRTSAHLAVVSAAEWQRHDVDTVIELCQDFLAALGLNLHLPAIRTTVQHLVRILAASAKATGHDFAFTDLYAISQSPHTLKAFLDDLQNLEVVLDAETRTSIAYLDGQLDHDGGYLQLVTVLSTARTVLSPLRTGALHVLCQPPFLDADQTLRRPGLLLAPATHTDFPEYDRFLAALLDLTLDRVLTAHRQEMHNRDAGSPPARPEALRLALHFHEPQRYYPDEGRQWIETARHDPRLSLLVDAQDPETYRRLSAREEERGELIFHDPGTNARAFTTDPGQAQALDELAEMPPGTALAHLPDLPAPVTLSTDGDRGART
jgi:hypothetical protein